MKLSKTKTKTNKKKKHTTGKGSDLYTYKQAQEGGFLINIQAFTAVALCKALHNIAEAASSVAPGP